MSQEEIWFHRSNIQRHVALNMGANTIAYNNHILFFLNLFDPFADVDLSNFFPGVSILGLLLLGQAGMSLDVILSSHLWFSPLSLPQPWSPVQYLRIPPVVH